MDIAQLIAATKGDRSYAHLSNDCGGDPTAGRLQQIATKVQVEFPKPPTIRALARGLRVSERTVVLAYAESLGLDAGANETRLALLLPAGAADLNDDQIAAVLATVRAMTMGTQNASRPTKQGSTSVDPPTRRKASKSKRAAARQAQIDEVHMEIDHENALTEQSERSTARDERSGLGS